MSFRLIARLDIKGDTLVKGIQLEGLRVLGRPEAFARHSDRCAVYTSTLGIELALMGLQPLVCGVPFYSRTRGSPTTFDRSLTTRGCFPASFSLPAAAPPLLPCHLLNCSRPPRPSVEPANSRFD